MGPLNPHEALGLFVIAAILIVAAVELFQATR